MTIVLLLCQLDQPMKCMDRITRKFKLFNFLCTVVSLVKSLNSPGLGCKLEGKMGVETSRNTFDAKLSVMASGRLSRL